MDQTTLILILVGAALIVLTVVLLIRGASKRSPEATTLDGQEKEVSPVITGPAAAPIDVPPAVDAAPLAPEPVPVERAGAAPIAVEPVTPVAPAPAPEPVGPPDELTTMKGVGPKVAALLNSLGVTRFDQIAAWTDDDVARVDAQLGAFKGRIGRDQWVEQARLLAAGDRAAYEAKFGKLG